MSHHELIQGKSPILIEVPHAGLTVPDEVRDQFVVVDEAWRDADLYVDELYALAPSRGASMLTTNVARRVVDLNRSAGDIGADAVPTHPDARLGHPRGVVWRTTTDGRVLLATELTVEQFQARIDAYHRPYHDALVSEVARIKEAFGYTIVIAAHSMPSCGRGSDRKRADVVPGTRGRSSADGVFIDAIDSYFRAAGLSVAHDDPYRGGFTTGHYGRPDDDIHVVQIELNRALYVDEATGERRANGFEALRDLLAGLVVELISVTP